MSTKACLTAALAAMLVVVSTAAPRAAAQPPDEAPPFAVIDRDVALDPPPFAPGDDFDSMPVILAQVRGLIAEAQNPAALAAAAQRLWQTHYMSGLVVLPTPDVPETAEMLRMHVRELQVSIEILDAAVRRGELDGEAFTVVLDVKTGLEAEVDALQTLAAWTITAPPGSPRARILHGRQIRSYFVPLPFPIKQPEEVVTSDVVGINECMVVVKEIQGVKRRLVLRVVPVWVEPWSARRRIVGFRLVWVLEYVPAQFIKRVITCNDCCNEISTQVLTEIVEHPELLDFWRFFKKGHYHGGKKPY